MKIIHLSDLHLGKMLHGVSLLENGDQVDWVEKFLALAARECPDAVVIAGDIYDRSMPSGAAMQLFSRLVTELSNRNVPVLITAGNHDSGERLSCFKDILSRQNIYIAGEIRRELTHVTFANPNDNFGPVTFWLMPYVFPAAIAHILGDDTIRDYDTAVRRLLAEQDVDFSQRNVLVAHQNVTKGGVEGIRGGSESMVGGIGQVDYTAFDGFDYVALGHIHAAYPVGRDSVRYAGSPMCYHFDELRQPKKGPVMVELGAKGTDPVIETLTIEPLHPMYELRGTYEELLKRVESLLPSTQSNCSDSSPSPHSPNESGLESPACGQTDVSALEPIAGTETPALKDGAYIKLVLTDRPMTPEINEFFQALFSSRGSILMERLSEFRRFTNVESGPEAPDLRQKPVEELFTEFYSARSGGESLDNLDAALLSYAAELLRNSDAGQDGKYVDPELTEKVLAFLEKEGC